MVIESDIRELLTIRDVAALLHVHTNTLRQWSNQGLIKAYRIGKRGDRRFNMEDVLTFMETSDKLAFHPVRQT